MLDPAYLDALLELAAEGERSPDGELTEHGWAALQHVLDQAEVEEGPLREGLDTFPVVLQSTNYSCGAACFEAVCRFHGLDLSEAQSARLLGTSPRMGTQPDALLGLADELGLATEAREACTPEDMAHAIALGAPCICAVQRLGRSGHWVVVTGVDEERVSFMDPMEGIRSLPREDFVSDWWDTAEGRHWERFALAVGPRPGLREAKDAQGHEHAADGRFGTVAGEHGEKEKEAPSAEPGARPRFEGARAREALAEHGRKVAEAHFADPHVKGLLEKKAALEAHLADRHKAMQYTPGQADQGALWQQIGEANDRLKKVREALSHESRRSMLLGFLVPGEEQASLRGMYARKSSQSTNWEKAADYLRQLTGKGASGDQQVYIRVAKGGRACYLASTIYTTKFDDPAISAHELGHHLEREAWVRERVAAFRARRFKDSEEVNLAEKFPQHGYDRHEHGNPDDMEKVFRDPSLAAYCGKTYGGGATEIVSMGLEMLYRDPAHFARADPEYFGLVVSILQEKRS